MKPFPSIITGHLLLLGGILLIFSLSINCHSIEKKEVIEESYASLDSSTSYTGMKTCRECHQSIYDSFIETGMGKSFDVASKTKSSGKYGDHFKIYDKFKDFWYKSFWENDSLRIIEFRLAGKDTVYKRTETVSYIVGSGQHTNSHIMNTNGYLNQMPMTYYTQKGQWDLPPGFENGGNSRFSRQIGLECMSCHNSYPEFSQGSENHYEFVDNGISCERCHGPGEKHVREKKAGKVVDISKTIDYTIVNPAKLPISLQLDVCQRCHIQGNAILNEGKTFFDFKPGMKLSDVMHVFMPVYKGREQEHIMASHVERLKLSKCFIASIEKAEKQSSNTLTPYKNALTCVTCHNPHVSVRNTGQEKFNMACSNCHSRGKEVMCSEESEKLKLKNNNCVSCHMPASGATDIPHVSVHDHYIRVPLKEEVIGAIKEFVGINCINNPSPSDEIKGRAFIAYFEKFKFGPEVLDSARKYFPDKTEAEIKKNFKELIQISFLEKNFDKVIYYTKVQGNSLKLLVKKSISNDDAWTSYRIGESYSEQGNIQNATVYYGRAYELAPLHPEFANKYATSLAQNNQISEARKILELTLLKYPKYAAALSNLGYLVLIQDKDTEKALNYYNKALDLDPDYDQAILNKAGLLIYTGKTAAAKKLLKSFIKRYPDHKKATELLNQLNTI